MSAIKQAMDDITESTELLLKTNANAVSKYNTLKAAVIKFGEDAIPENWSAIEDIIGVKIKDISEE